jgi:hypothetical protein
MCRLAYKPYTAKQWNAWPLKFNKQDAVGQEVLEGKNIII